MPLILTLIGALVRAVGPLVAQVMLSLGFSFITFTGVQLAVDTFKADALAALGSNGGVFMQFMGVFQVGTAVNMIASAITARLVLKGLTGGGITKMITKK